jgi:ditrans,polycis-polyprenyl diphosphate synthase
MEWCLELGIKELTVFALSTDNLKRAQVEVDTLMRLAKETFAKMAEQGGFLEQNGIQVKIIGDMEMLPKDVAEAMKKTEELTKENRAARLNVCLCYSSKDEIAQAFENTAELASQGKLPS